MASRLSRAARPRWHGSGKGNAGHPHLGVRRWGLESKEKWVALLEHARVL